MGIDTTFYIGPYLKIKSGLKVSHPVEEKICPKCDKCRDTKFCSVCGTEVILSEKESTITYTDPYNISYLLAPGTEDRIDRIFTSFNYGPDDVFIANYSSDYIINVDRDDIGTLVNSSKIIGNVDITVAEFRRRGKDFFILLDNNDVGYEIGHGIIVGAY